MIGQILAGIGLVGSALVLMVLGMIAVAGAIEFVNAFFKKRD